MKPFLVLMILASTQVHASWGNCENSYWFDRNATACMSLITIQILFPPLFTGFALSNLTDANIFKAETMKAELEKYEATGIMSPVLKSALEMIQVNYRKENQEISEEEILYKLETTFLK